MYSPLNSIKNSGGRGEYVTHGGGSPCVRTTKLPITVSVKMMDSHLWLCRIQWFQCIATLSVFRLDHLPAVARGIAEAGIHGSVAVDRFLSELHARGEHRVVRGTTVGDC
jgi:hypothetical protein